MIAISNPKLCVVSRSRLRNANQTFNGNLPLNLCNCAYQIPDGKKCKWVAYTNSVVGHVLPRFGCNNKMMVHNGFNCINKWDEPEDCEGVVAVFGSSPLRALKKLADVLDELSNFFLTVDEKKLPQTIKMHFFQ